MKKLLTSTLALALTLTLGCEEKSGGKATSCDKVKLLISSKMTIILPINIIMAI